MVDDKENVWLLEINTNPDITTKSPLLSRLIPQMVENAFKICIDPIFPPPPENIWNFSKKMLIPDNIFNNNKFELILDVAY